VSSRSHSKGFQLAISLNVNLGLSLSQDIDKSETTPLHYSELQTSILTKRFDVSFVEIIEFAIHQKFLALISRLPIYKGPSANHSFGGVLQHQRLSDHASFSHCQPQRHENAVLPLQFLRAYICAYSCKSVNPLIRICTGYY
jgi:hypothetical protein